MSWIIIIIIAYLLNATATAVDKFLLKEKISNAAVYAFIISVMSLLALVLAPFGFHLAPWSQILVALASGIIFTFALLYMYKAVGANEISRISPFIGGTQPIFTLILAAFILGEWLSPLALVGFGLLVFGSLVISRQQAGEHKRGYGLALLASLLFALSYTLSKQVFNDQGFLSGFIWTRIGAFIGALLLLLIPGNFKDIVGQIKSPQKQTGSLLIIGQVCGALSAVLVFYAISISSSVALINATRGLEYVFLLIIVLSLSGKYPKLLDEKLSGKIIFQKITATILIILGLAVLAMS